MDWGRDQEETADENGATDEILGEQLMPDPSGGDGWVTDFLTLFQRAVDATTFNVARLPESVPAPQLRTYYEAAKQQPNPFITIPTRWYESSRADIPPLHGDPFLQCVAQLLDRYTHEGVVGFAPGRIFGPYAELDLETVVRRLVVSGALCGVKDTTNVFRQWLGGDPARFTHMTVLQGVAIEGETLTYREGVRLERLPKDDSLFRVVPEGIAESTYGRPDRSGLPGSTVLCVDAEIPFVFYHPDGPESQIPLGEGISFPLPWEDWNEIPQALSLLSDSKVFVTYTWQRIEAPTRILICRGDGYAHNNLNEFAEFETPIINQNHVDEARHLIPKLQQKRHLAVAIARWMRSKSGDPFIDLRIALESLYGEPGSHESTFKVATNGAWHLGTTSEERIKYEKILRKLYKRASEVIHGGTASKEGDQELFVEARAACREGILKRLDEPKRIDFKKLRLGAGGSGAAQISAPP